MALEFNISCHTSTMEVNGILFVVLKTLNSNFQKFCNNQSINIHFINWVTKRNQVTHDHCKLRCPYSRAVKVVKTSVLHRYF